MVNISHTAFWEAYWWIHCFVFAIWLNFHLCFFLIERISLLVLGNGLVLTRKQTIPWRNYHSNHWCILEFQASYKWSPVDHNGISISLDPPQYKFTSGLTKCLSNSVRVPLTYEWCCVCQAKVKLSPSHYLKKVSLLSIGPVVTNERQMCIKVHNFSTLEIQFDVSSAIYWSFCSDHNVLKTYILIYFYLNCHTTVTTLFILWWQWSMQQCGQHYHLVTIGRQSVTGECNTGPVNSNDVTTCHTINSLRPSDAYMRQWTNHHWFR